MRFLVQTLISQPNTNQIKPGSKSKLAHCKLKRITILEIKNLVFMLCSIRQNHFIMQWNDPRAKVFDRK